MKMPMKKILAPSESSDDSDDFMPKEKHVKLDCNSDDYQQRRQRNNVAVRKSREKSRAKARETIAQVKQLRQENEQLEQKVTILSKELSVLKDLFLAHAGTVTDVCATTLPPVTDTIEVTVSSDHQYSAFKLEN